MLDDLALVECPGEVQAHDGHPREHQEVGEVAEVSQGHTAGVIIQGHVHTNSAVIMGISGLFVEDDEVEEVDKDGGDNVGDDNLPVEGSILLDDDVHVEGGEETEQAHDPDKGVESVQPAPVTSVRVINHICHCEDVIPIMMESGLNRRKEVVLIEILQELVTNYKEVFREVVVFDAEINTVMIFDI